MLFYYRKIFLFFTIQFLLFSNSLAELPIIYHEKYNIPFDELKKVVPYRYVFGLDLLVCNKAKSLYEYFKDKHGVKIYFPKSVEQKELLLVHSQRYIDSFCNNESILNVLGIHLSEQEILKLPLKNELQEMILEPVKLTVSGTILGAELALRYGCAVNLGGGFHHAGISSGGGFCFFNDIAIATLKLLEIKKDFKILIVDLDAHWGNGTQEILENNKQVFVFDVYNGERQSFSDHISKETNIHNFPIAEGTETERYLEVVESNFLKLVDSVKPDLIIYNAGTDIFEQDVLGGLKVSFDGILRRDSLIIKTAKAKKIPILMLLSGGYTQTCVNIIKQSIDNILKMFSQESLM